MFLMIMAKLLRGWGLNDKTDDHIRKLNPVPEIGYKDEIIAMQPIVINGDLSNINRKNYGSK